MLELVLMLAASDPCIVVQRTSSPTSTATIFVRVCTRAADTSDIPLGLLVDGTAAEQYELTHKNVVEFGIASRSRKTLWMDGDLDAATMSDACRGPAADALFDGRLAQQRARSKSAIHCILESVPRIVGWSVKDRYVALQLPGVLSRVEIWDLHLGTRPLRFEAFNRFAGNRVSGLIAWPRGCRPIDLDAIEHDSYYPCLKEKPTGWDTLVISVDLPTGSLLDATVVGPHTSQ